MTTQPENDLEKALEDVLGLDGIKNIWGDAPNFYHAVEGALKRETVETIRQALSTALTPRPAQVDALEISDEEFEADMLEDLKENPIEGLSDKEKERIKSRLEVITNPETAPSVLYAMMAMWQRMDFLEGQAAQTQDSGNEGGEE